MQISQIHSVKKGYFLKNIVFNDVSVEFETGYGYNVVNGVE